MLKSPSVVGRPDSSTHMPSAGLPPEYITDMPEEDETNLILLPEAEAGIVEEPEINDEPNEATQNLDYKNYNPAEFLPPDIGAKYFPPKPQVKSPEKKTFKIPKPKLATPKFMKQKSTDETRSKKKSRNPFFKQTSVPESRMYSSSKESPVITFTSPTSAPDVSKPEKDTPSKDIKPADSGAIVSSDEGSKDMLLPSAPRFEITRPGDRTPSPKLRGPQRPGTLMVRQERVEGTPPPTPSGSSPRGSTGSKRHRLEKNMSADSAQGSDLAEDYF